MEADQREAAVVIVGGGVAGLTLATFLHTAGVSCIVLERRDRSYVEVRARAGVVEARGIAMFERWGLADRLLGGPVAETIDYRFNGVGRVFQAVADARLFGGIISVEFDRDLASVKRFLERTRLFALGKA